MSKIQDEWEGTSESPPTVTDQYQKDKTSGSEQANSTNSDWPMSKRQDEWESKS